MATIVINITKTKFTKFSSKITQNTQMALNDAKTEAQNRYSDNHGYLEYLIKYLFDICYNNLQRFTSEDIFLANLLFDPDVYSQLWVKDDLKDNSAVELIRQSIADTNATLLRISAIIDYIGYLSAQGSIKKLKFGQYLIAALIFNYKASNIQYYNMNWNDFMDVFKNDVRSILNVHVRKYHKLLQRYLNQQKILAQIIQNLNDTIQMDIDTTVNSLINVLSYVKDQVEKIVQKQQQVQRQQTQQTTQQVQTQQQTKQQPAQQQIQQPQNTPPPQPLQNTPSKKTGQK